MIAVKLLCLFAMMSMALCAPCDLPSWVAQSPEAAAFFQQGPEGPLSGAALVSMPPLPMHICWYLTSDGSSIVFSVAAQQSRSMGWVAMGISSGGGMNGADIAALVWDETKKSYALRDYFAPATNVMIEDKVNNLYLHRVITSGTMVAFNFSRPVVPCDVEDDIAVPVQTAHLIGALGTTQAMKHHGRNRASVTVMFFESKLDQVKPVPNAAEVVRELKITTSVVMPSKETTYYCQPFELPRDRKYQAIAFKPIGINEYVHHEIMFLCPSNPNRTQAGECGTSGMNCQTFMVGWAVGNKGLSYPSDGGYPFGYDDGSRWGVLQVHLHNPELQSGVMINDVGFAVEYTGDLRPIDHGVFTLGIFSTKNFFLPPQMKFTSQVSVCPGDCTSLWKSPITISGIGFHMHQLGRSIWLEHTRRDGKVLPPVGLLPYWDFSMGGFVGVPNVVVEPGDTLVLHCAYDTSSKNTTTYGGEATTQEMCLAFINYFPKSQTMELSIDLSDIPQISGIFGTASICGTLNSVRSAPGDTSRLLTMLKPYKKELRSKPIVPPLSGAACTNLSIVTMIDTPSGSVSLFMKPSYSWMVFYLISLLYALL